MFTLFPLLYNVYVVCGGFSWSSTSAMHPSLLALVRAEIVCICFSFILHMWGNNDGLNARNSEQQ